MVSYLLPLNDVQETGYEKVALKLLLSKIIIINVPCHKIV